MDVLVISFRYYDATTQKQETIEFQDYYYHLKKFGFTREHAPPEFKYEIALSADERTFTKKLAVGKFTRHRTVVDESRIIYTNNNNQTVTISSEYTSEVPSYFNIKKP